MMIHHFSIAAQNPLQVARVLAEIWHGKLFNFFSNPDSYLVTPFDEYGSAIEVYPWGDQITPGHGDEPAYIEHKANLQEFVATHAALSVRTSEAQIKQIGEREGWRVVVCNRGAFSVIEFWIENRFMLELLTPELATQYLQFTSQPQMVEQIFGLPITTHHV